MSSFCSAKATHIFSAKNNRILYIESTKTVNEMTPNELVNDALNNWARIAIESLKFALFYGSVCDCMSLFMTKPIKWKCAQQRHSLRRSQEESRGPSLPIDCT